MLAFVRVQAIIAFGQHYPPLSQNDAWYLRQTIQKDAGFWHVRLGIILGGAQLIVFEGLFEVGKVCFLVVLLFPFLKSS